MRIHRSLTSAALSVGLILFLSACGGGGGGGAAPPPPPAPSATTTDADPIATDNAVLNGDVNPNGLLTTAWFEHGTDALLTGIVTKTGDQPIGSGNTPVSIAQPISGLIPGNTYYYRVAAQNSAGTSRGAIDSFTAALLPPTVSTLAANPVSNDNAVLNGEVNPNGLGTSAWFEWGTDPTLNVRNITSSDNVGTGAASVTIHASLTNLTPGTTYYFRVAAQNTVGATKGTIRNFKASQIPTATTNAATSVTSNSATLNGSVNPNGLQTNYWFVWGTDPNLTNPVLIQETPMQGIAAGTFTTQPVSAVPPPLSAGTTYYFRLVARNAAGEQQGTIRNFATSVSPPPTAITNVASLNPATTSAVLNGNVNPNGYATNAWFEWGTSPTLATFNTTSNQPMGSGTTTVVVNATVSGLTPYSTYYYRVAASNSGGTQKGAILPTSQFYVAVGDSITVGSGDPTGDGYEPKLSNLLTASKGYLNTIAKVGVSGTTSADGAISIENTLSTYPFVDTYLILYGTNDAEIPAVPSGMGLIPGDAGYSGSYKDNMQRIISAILAEGKIPYLAKVPYVDPTNPLFPAGLSYSDGAIQQYNQAIDELRVENGISVVAPDNYTWFHSHTSQLANGLHPNGTGYQSMADLWFTALP